MASTAVQNSFRVASIVFSGGAFTFPDPIGGSVDEKIDWAKNRPSTRLSPATAMDGYDVDAVAECSMRFTPIVRGTTGSLTYSLLEYDGSTTGTVVVTGLLAGEYHADMKSKPHTHSQHFTYNAGNTENIAPVSFT